MNPAEASDLVVRQAQPADLDAILDLLTEYDLPRAYFEPYYRHDPTYRPEQSWIVEQAGRLAAHLRVYDRWIRFGGGRLRIAGVGNVITARAYRGRGLAGRLLRAMLAGVHAAGFPYSLLWTHLPELYGRYGWAPIEEQRLEARLPPPGPLSFRLAPFRPADLPAVMQLYDVSNAARTGPVLRSAEYWRGQLGWLDESRAGFLLARTTTGELLGYVRSRPSAVATEILELGLTPGAREAGRALLGAAAMGTTGQLLGLLPPSLASLFAAEERQMAAATGLMGRVVDLDALLRVLEPLWRQRLEGATLPPGTLFLTTSGGNVELQVSATGVQTNRTDAVPVERALNEVELAHLLFHGFDAAASELFAGRPEELLLPLLFPPQDFVLWPADAF